MSDVPEKPLKRLTLLAVDSADFVRFIQAKAGVEDEVCPVCKTSEWTVLCPDDDGPTLRIGMVVRNRPKEHYLSTFGYFCDSCGHVRMHMAQTVHKWVAENPAFDADPVDDIRLDDDESLGDA